MFVKSKPTDSYGVQVSIFVSYSCNMCVCVLSGKIVPIAYGINKLQICCVIEDDKVSSDWLEESITSIEDLVQSVDVVAFNKV